MRVNPLRNRPFLLDPTQEEKTGVEKVAITPKDTPDEQEEEVKIPNAAHSASPNLCYFSNMNTTSDPREVPVDVLPPLPEDSRSRDTTLSGPQPPLAGLKTFYHPASGVAILGIDLLFFGPEAIFPPDMPFLCPLAFLLTFPLVYFFQLKWSRNAPSAAFGKAFLGAFLAGLPFSIVGGVFGAAVIALSGLPSHPLEALKKIPGVFSKLSNKA